MNLEIELNSIIKVPELGWRRGWDPKVVESFDAIQGWGNVSKVSFVASKGRVYTSSVLQQGGMHYIS